MNADIFTGIVIALLAAFLAVIVFRAFQQQRTIKTLRRDRDEIEIEEHRMFDFLHSLGETLAREKKAPASILHKVIVQGVTMVVDARGGALYLLDKKKETLVSKYRSPACPPLVNLPHEILPEARTSEKVRASHTKLVSVPIGEGLIGTCIEKGESIRLDDIAASTYLDEENASLHDAVSVMAAPLQYGEKKLGVLVVANEKAQQFTSNDFDVFRSVAEQSAFALGTALVHDELEAKRDIERELRTAREVQKILLPTEPPKLDQFRIVGANAPAKLVSGDYFDYIQVDDIHYGVAIADVSGKGIGASLIMAMCRSVMHAKARQNLSPAAVLREVNRVLFPDIREDMFISMAYMILNTQSDEVVIARAGHDAPLHFSKATDSVERLQTPGIALGIDGGEVFDRATQDHYFRLESGDSLLLYTDGANEALNADGDEFGLEQLEAHFMEIASEGAERTIKRLRAAIRKFAGNQPQNDDITLIAIEKR
ncbi:MAG: GAF domain-containing SpoIIE family protein phosphatase [Verrucomicrobiota bacterium]